MLVSTLTWCSLPCFTLATVTLSDPSDIIPPATWAADNAIVPNYSDPFLSVQPSPIIATYEFDGNNSTSIDHLSLSTFENQTSVILAANGAELNLSYVNVLKEGYSDDLIEASFWGFNAAINANASTAYFDHVNVTVHNGAANIYAYGTGTVVYLENAWLYSSGPVSHGVYASGNGTVYASHVSHYSGGKRSSSFSGDSPAGYVHISDSIAHSAGVGSATYYALGEIYADNVVSISENGPVVFMDGQQKAYLSNCDATAGLLGGVALFSSAVRASGALLSVASTKITTLGDEMPGLWFGNLIIDVTLHDTEIVTASGVLIVSNFSQITQDFDHYADYSEQPNLAPAIVNVTVSESDLVGDLVAYNESSITLALTSYSNWTGAAYSGYGNAYFDISLDSTSYWILTNTTTVQNLTNEDVTLSNIYSSGFDLYYNSSAVLNSYLNGQTLSLPGGGSAIPSS
ncbi:hypothetical protein BP5796_10477 [Coleophoma crateriformis]|uniref:Uncharacterized protein n=1 Tax=Coleophoma crateriformis TaxID=565419 RepID=A0A3D8QQ99_9HELO|nr:hypothetical protein BP5796_10477 [Coleophoma crateriformis]